MRIVLGGSLGGPPEVNEFSRGMSLPTADQWE